MITLTRLDGSKLTVNADLIEFLEPTPDTVISLVSGKRVIVREQVAEVVHQVVEYRRRVLVGCFVQEQLGQGER